MKSGLTLPRAAFCAQLIARLAGTWQRISATSQLLGEISADITGRVLGEITADASLGFHILAAGDEKILQGRPLPGQPQLTHAILSRRGLRNYLRSFKQLTLTSKVRSASLRVE